MSFKFTALALDHGPADTFEKVLLMALCDRSNEKGVCWPSRDDLMRRSGASYATVSRKLRILEVKGWIQRKRQYNSSTVFRVNVARLLRLDAEATAQRAVSVPKGFEPFEDEALQPVENKGTVHSEPTSVHCDTHMSSQGTPNLSKNPSKNLQKPAALSLDSLKEKATAFQRSLVLSGHSVQIAGQLLAGGSPEMDRLRELFRADA